MVTGEWDSDVYGLLPHLLTSRVLMVPQEGGWSLPGAPAEGRIEFTPRLVIRR
jgi:hypothetical protein